MASTDGEVSVLDGKSTRNGVGHYSGRNQRRLNTSARSDLGYSRKSLIE